MADGGASGVWAIAIMLVVVLAALYIFFDLLGFTPGPSATSSH